MPIIDFLAETYQHRSPNVSSTRLLNLYPELVGPDSKGAARVPFVLIGTSGTEVFSDLEEITPNTSCRGMYYTSTGRLFTVYGANLVETTANGVSTVKSSALGTLTTVVSMVDNGIDLVLADSQNLYVYNLKTGVTTTPNLPFSNPIKVGYLASRFFAINNGFEDDPEFPNSTSTKNRLYWSDLIDASSWPALNFTTAEKIADPIISFSIRQNDIWLFGPRSYEVFGISPNPDLPYQPIPAATSDIGCGAPNSVTSISDNVFWLGSSTAGTNQVFVSNGYGATRITNHAIEDLLNNDPERTEDAISFAYQENGHIFYVISFVAVNKTFVYDLLTGMWHERGTREPLKNIVNRWEPVFSSFAFSRVVVGDSKNPKILRLDLNKYEEWDGRPIVRILQGKTIWSDLKNIIHRRFLLDLETGVGLQTGQGSDPQAMMQFSDDGGHTFSSQQFRSIGKIGKYKKVLEWRYLGMARERVYKISISDPIKVVISGARIFADEVRNP